MNKCEFDQLVEEICAVAIPDPQTPLVDLGVDSLKTVALVMAIEERCGVEIDPEVLADPARISPAGLWHVVRGRLAGSQPTSSGS
ncbi:hypothetical protein GCM10009799_02180 [Nocardiopsis rhodophaea]|uniref:Carrier domain-containing protein n=1 Tax=Nocardiopsis rhodophaea TaxID=280238 RepID=A0ABN2S5W8_9ACTN